MTISQRGQPNADKPSQAAEAGISGITCRFGGQWNNCYVVGGGKQINGHSIFAQEQPRGQIKVEDLVVVAGLEHLTVGSRELPDVQTAMKEQSSRVYQISSGGTMLFHGKTMSGEFFTSTKQSTQINGIKISMERDASGELTRANKKTGGYLLASQGWKDIFPPTGVIVATRGDRLGVYGRNDPRLQAVDGNTELVHLYEPTDYVHLLWPTENTGW